MESNNPRFIGSVEANVVQFSFSVKADVCLTIVLIHIMLLESYNDFTVDHPSVAVELKVPRPTLLNFSTKRLSVALKKKNQIVIPGLVARTTTITRHSKPSTIQMICGT